MRKSVVLLGAVPCQSEEHFREEQLGVVSERVLSNANVKRYVTNIVLHDAKESDAVSCGLSLPGRLGIYAIDELWMDGECPLDLYDDCNVMGAFLCDEDESGSDSEGMFPFGEMGLVASSAEPTFAEGCESASGACAPGEPSYAPPVSYDRFSEIVCPSSVKWKGLFSVGGGSSEDARKRRNKVLLRLGQNEASCGGNVRFVSTERHVRRTF